jgi:IMP dehydrogenase
LIIESSLEALGYDDVLLLPQHSNIKSRDDVNLFVSGKEYMPIFSAPMLNISEPELVIELGRLGGNGLLHRFFDNPKERYESIEKISEFDYSYGISISIREFEEELKYALYAIKNGATWVCIDTASAYLSSTLEAVKQLLDFRSSNHLMFDIMGGNVVDEIGAYKLALSGANSIRVNIGTGLQCLTSKSIGIGCPPLTAIKNTSLVKDRFPDVNIICDGGIRNSGDALKALCFGGDSIMIGSLFGKAIEAGNNGEIWGMSSYKMQERMNKPKKSNEGRVTNIPQEEIKPLREIYSEFTYGLKSGLSYLGCDNINDLHNMEIEYIKIKGE